jgi:hypothetical protein
MSKTRDTGYLANVIQVHDTGVRIMSGSTMLMAISSSGAVTITGEISGSDAANALLLSGTGSVGFTTTSSFLEVSSSQQQVSASYIALSASYNMFSGSASTRTTQIENVYATTGSNSFRADQSITGSLVVSSTITAQTLVVQTVTSSIVYSSGSNIFGSALGDRQTFTGSLNVTGSSHSIFGNVGIGLNNPTNRLEVQSGDIKLNAGALRCTNIFFGLTGTNYGKIQYSDIDGSMLITTIGSGAGYDLNLGTQCTTRLTILGDGKVGIGTATPLSTFHVNCCIAGGATATVARFGVQDSTGYGTTSPAIELVGTNIGLCFTMGKIAGINDVSSGGAMAFSTGLCAATVLERMRITNTGNVGIGTSSPCTLLHTVIPTGYGTNGTVANSYPVATFSQCDCAGGARGLQIGVPTGGVVSPVFLKVSNTSARFSILDSSNCENFTISGGNVGIGTCSPTLALSVIGQVRAGYATGAGLTIGLSPVGVPNNDLNAYVAWSDAASFGENNGDLVYVPRTSTTAHHRFYTGNVGLASEKMRITNDGYLRLMSRGIQFNGDTSDSNSLDDYEEGDWTPALDGNGSSPSYTNQFGKYTKIGRLVHLVGKVGLTNGSGGGIITITGLPFGSANATDAGQRSSARVEGDFSGFGNPANIAALMFRVNGSNLSGVYANSSGGSSYATYNLYAGTFYFNFNVTYYT